MPTHEELPRFLREYAKLTAMQQRAVKAAVKLLIEGLEGGSPNPKLRIKRVQGHPGVWEITWARDGRATFTYGHEVRTGDPHIIWRRVGTHDIFKTP